MSDHGAGADRGTRQDSRVIATGGDSQTAEAAFSGATVLSADAVTCLSVQVNPGDADNLKQIKIGDQLTSE